MILLLSHVYSLLITLLHYNTFLWKKLIVKIGTIREKRFVVNVYIYWYIWLNLIDGMPSVRDRKKSFEIFFSNYAPSVLIFSRLSGIDWKKNFSKIDQENGFSNQWFLLIEPIWIILVVFWVNFLTSSDMNVESWKVTFGHFRHFWNFWDCWTDQNTTIHWFWLYKSIFYNIQFINIQQ